MYNILKLFLSFILISCLSSQTTGKISGKVIDLKTKEPIVGANVMLLNTSIGTSTDNEGNYYLINLSLNRILILIIRNLENCNK